jgi:hypothetical protein
MLTLVLIFVICLVLCVVSMIAFIGSLVIYPNKVVWYFSIVLFVTSISLAMITYQKIDEYTSATSSVATSFFTHHNLL